MKNINLIDTVVSTDTDFIASEVSMVTDINLEKETIFYVNSNYFFIMSIKKMDMESKQLKTL